MYDLTVVGGGPAGTAAAITAARAGVRVLLLERGKLPRNRVCGEFVSAESLGLLRSLLGDAESERLSRAGSISAMRLFSDGIAIQAGLEAAAASIARFDLDLALWNAAVANGVDARLEHGVRRVEGDGPFRVTAGGTTFESQALVNASGRWSNVSSAAKTTQFKKQRSKWVGIKAHFAEKQPAPSVDLYFFEGGYCGVQPVSFASDDRSVVTNVCAKVRADRASTLAEVLDAHPKLRERSRGWTQVTDTVTTSPLLFHKPEPLAGTMLLAGDAAGFVDPFVGDGISLALRSGALSARALAGFFAGWQSLEESARWYEAQYRREFSYVFGTSAKVRHMFFAMPRVLRLAILAAVQRNPGLVRHVVKRTR